MIEPRKLTAIDLFFLGPKIIIAEYVLAVVLCIGLGVWTLVRVHGLWPLLSGSYLVAIGINYVPMLFHSIDITKRRSVQAEIGPELANRRYAMAKFRRQSLWLLVPLSVLWGSKVAAGP